MVNPLLCEGSYPPVTCSLPRHPTEEQPQHQPTALSRLIKVKEHFPFYVSQTSHRQQGLQPLGEWSPSHRGTPSHGAGGHELPTAGQDTLAMVCWGMGKLQRTVLLQFPSFLQAGWKTIPLADRGESVCFKAIIMLLCLTTSPSPCTPTSPSHPCDICRQGTTTACQWPGGGWQRWVSGSWEQIYLVIPPHTKEGRQTTKCGKKT